MLRTAPTHACLLASTLVVAGCGSPSPRQQFDDEVAPLLEGSCLSTVCHGVAPDAEARGEVIDWNFFHVRLGQSGVIADLGQAYQAAKARINTRERPELSTLLRKPLAVSAGGLPHIGGVQLASRASGDYRTLRRWVAAESGGGEGHELDELTPTEQRFGAEVLPELAARQCTNQACHGSVAPFTAFEPPMVIDDELVFSAAALKKNHHAARMHLFLGGDPMQSRLVRKVLPLEAGGIPHRGGNDIFFRDPSDAGIAAIVGWAEDERRELLGDQAPEVSGVVLVRGPVAPEKAFSHDAFVTGSDLWVLEPATPNGKLRNLTGASHAAPADVRNPAVSHDGKRVAFAMRREAAEALNIWEIGLDGNGLRQLTHDAAELAGGGIAANVEPSYGPDGRIYFVSTRAGQLAEGYDGLDAEVWAVDPATGALERLTFDPFPEASPAFFGTGKSYGTLAFTMRRTLGGRFEAPVFRMPLDHNKTYHGDPEIHIHHGITASPNVVYATRATAEGRFACVLLDRDNVWRGGALAVFERQFGPDLPAGAESEAATGGFRHAFSRLSAADVTTGGPSAGGLYRHPAPLPDGRLLVSRTKTATDLSDPEQAPDLGLVVVRLEENRETAAPRIAEETLLLDEPGVAEYDAEPIVARPPEDDPTHEPAWDATRESDTGVLALRHVQVLESIFANLEQRGPKVLRDDFAYLRLVESVPVTPSQQATAPIGLGENGLSRVLAEVPLAGGSAYLRVPADRPFRTQFLNADRMAVGAQHNRFNHVAPGEKFPGGVAPELYPTLCAGCHGAGTGNPSDLGGLVPDMVSAASVTLATHENGDPRRPLEPVAVGNDALDVTFVADVLPLVERSCQSCHSGGAPAGGLHLGATPTAKFDSAYETLLAEGEGSTGGRVYVDARGTSAFGSLLIERILGRDLGAPRNVAGSCSGAPPLSEAERLTFVRWIDLGAPYRGVSP